MATAADMDWGVSFFYIALTVLALGLAFRFPERWYAIVLLGNVVGSSLSLGWLSDDAANRLQPAVQLLFEFVTFEAAMICCVVFFPAELAVFTWLAMLSAISMSFSTNQALQYLPFGGYQFVVNAILVVQCATIARRGLTDVVGRVYNVVRARGRMRRVLDGMPVLSDGMAPVSQNGRSARHDPTA